MTFQLVGRLVVSVFMVANLACSPTTWTTPRKSSGAAAAIAPAEPALLPTDEEWEFAGRYRDQALDALMPLRSEGVVVAYRAVHSIDPSEVESYFAVDVGKLHRLYGATVVSPVGQSITEQVIRLHRADPGASFESVLPRIKVDRRTTNVEACPGLGTRMSNLHRVRVPMSPNPNVITLDGVVHNIVVDGFVEVSDNNDENPAALWAMQTLAILTKCVESR